VAALVLGALGATLSTVSGFAEDAAAPATYGRHLASECTACHRPDAGESAIPAIAGRPAAELIALLSDYRDGRKTNPVMVSVARSLDARQTEALAAYFASLPKSAKTSDPR
jgi:cytochrome c553